jgi:hypothetical protein
MINSRAIAVEYRLSHWAEVMEERNTSGLSIKAYCESIGLHQNVYFYWQRKLREAACSELPPATVSGNGISKVPNGWAVCGTASNPSTDKENGITIEIGKSRVTANAEVDLELLGNICRMLMSLC